MSEKPFSQACENNKKPLLEKLYSLFKNQRTVLEIGSGTGQHAVYFAEHLVHLRWQTSDQAHYHQGIQVWLDEAKLKNVASPMLLAFPVHSEIDVEFDAVFTANTAHIMQVHEVKSMMEWVGNRLPSNGVFCQYGPFTENGDFSSKSNQDFHHKLISEGYGGYRDISELKEWAVDLQLESMYLMPANNILLFWRKQ